MQIFVELFDFFFSLFDIIAIPLGGYVFTLGGAVIFACLLVCSLAVIKWLFNL